MNINRDIVDDYLSGKPLQECAHQWVFHAIVDGRYLAEEVPVDSRTTIQRAVDLLEEKLSAFHPFNGKLWDAFFPDWQTTIETTTVFLVVGCPEPYDAMTRTAPSGNEVLLFDVNRMMKYVDGPDALALLLRQMLTHECTHTCLHRRYPLPDSASSFLKRLQYVCFDEGTAHFLSFREDVRQEAWTSGENLRRKEHAHTMLRQAVLCHDPDQQTALLQQADTGDFWDKFGAIAGMFAFADALGKSDKKSDALSGLYDRGPADFLPEFFPGRHRSS